MASIEEGPRGLTPVERDAARGKLPDWARAGRKRREHMARVAELMQEWASGLALGEEEILRWEASAWLHDALRDADPAALIGDVRPEERDLPGEVLHGPAAASRLASQVDPCVAAAIRYHTIGHPSLDRMGRALYLADFLEPGRNYSPVWRAELRSRMPAEQDAVLVEVIGSRISHIVERRKPLRSETAAFWTDALRQAGR